MANELITLATELYSGDVHLAFQNKGYKLAAFTRQGTMAASKLYWPKLAALTGSGQAGPAVGAQLTFVGGTHSQVSVEVTDRYATPLMLKSDDLEKITSSIDYRQAYASNQIDQLGRHADDQIMTAFAAGKNATVLGPGSTVSLTMAHIDELIETFELAEIPDDGQRVVFIRPEVYSQLKKFKEFSNADYVGDNLPYKGGGMTEAKMWQGFMWVKYNRIPVDGTTKVASCMAWHPSCIGHGVNMAPQSKIFESDLHGGQYGVYTKQSMGAAVIDSTGVYEWAVDTDVAPTP